MQRGIRAWIQLEGQADLEVAASLELTEANLVR